ncbi:MAG: ROK family transcriptional regulator [Candidatus Aminicenantes bacterium]|nr:ROK family transcriptional regulator [Candidatus Aminicenantes bacterium]
MTKADQTSDPNGGAKYINRLNKVKVLKIIRTAEALSRADISKISSLSAPTVSRIIEDLLDEDLVQEIGEGESQGGRPPTLLKFSDRKNFIIGLDLGTTNIYGVLSDFDAKIIAEIKTPTHVEEGFAGIMKRTSGVIAELIAEPSVANKRIYGIGMAVAGLINRKRNIVEFSPDFHWHNVDVVGALSKTLPYPIIIDNVTRVMALGEMWYGLGKRFKNLICVNVGYGIGAGIIINGKPLYGPLGLAGEFGHITLEKDSPVQCDCGNFGCLEALASGNAIAKAARQRLLAGERSLLLDACEGDPTRVTSETVANAAKEGDPLAWEIFDRAVEYLGIGIAGLVNLFSPEAIVIGGGVAQSGDILFEKVRKTVQARSLNKISSDVLIRPATFGMKAAVMGAVSLVLNEVINLNHNQIRVPVPVQAAEQQ